jgi:phosphopantothenoylcysteine decarboxylase/phosphopantothenate--cysteine ligase
MGGDSNTVMLITGDNAESWPRATKVEVAERLALKIAQALA